MASRKISADRIWPVAGPPIDHGVIVIDDANTIIDVGTIDQFEPGSIEFYSGDIVPGFINTHCHLELSHMKGVIPTGTKLIPFIRDIVNKRTGDSSIISEAIRSAEDEMIQSGIVAVGDISNTPDTFPTKEKNRLRYHTFIEVFDFLQGGSEAENIYKNARRIYQSLRLPSGHKKAMVPHAPYSVSQDLYALLRKEGISEDSTTSIHMQETQDEMELFSERKGAFYHFFEGFGKDIRHFQPNDQRPQLHAMAHMDAGRRTLMVHNTCTSASDINAARNWSKNVFWSTCANANLYIENRLPDYKVFIDSNARMTIGTDSLASNWQLNILEEMKTIHRYNSWIPFEKLLTWATVNGAQALGFDEILGTIQPGKSPGLVLITYPSGRKYWHHDAVAKLIVPSR